jgi:hypothetical protein
MSFINWKEKKVASSSSSQRRASSIEKEMTRTEIAI